MAEGYKCSNCGLAFELGTDHLKDPDGDIAWLSFMYCEICGTNLRIFSTKNGYGVQSLRSPIFQNGKDKLSWIELFSSEKEPDLNEIQCQNCKNNGTIRADLVNNICPNCQVESLDMEYFNMT